MDEWMKSKDLDRNIYHKIKTRDLRIVESFGYCLIVVRVRAHHEALPQLTDNKTI